jgi:predicted alpha/beta hydrolase family esterase
MKNAIILHGSPEKSDYYDAAKPAESNRAWLPWLQRQLQLKDIKADTPEVPYSYDPRLDLWTKEFERFEVGPETLLIGHSCGAGFLVRWLSEHKKVQVKKVILVAPLLDPDRNVTTDFFDFQIDPDLLTRADKFLLYHSSNDMPSVQKSVAQIREALPDIIYREFSNRGHFGDKDIKNDKFPELLEECLSS